MFKRRLITLFLLFSVFSSSFLPVFAPKAHALLGVGDIVVDVKALLRTVVDGIAMATAQRMVDQIVASTVKWANTGFDGNPAYVTNPEQFFTNVADRAAGDFINRDPHLGFLCSPFKDSIRISLIREYYNPPENAFQCSISGIGENFEDFYEKFDTAGWEGWFTMTQNAKNNPYGAYQITKLELDSRVASALQTAETEHLIGQGFLSLKECAAYNPSQSAINDYENGTYGPGSPGQDIFDKKIPYDETKPAGACIRDGAIRTAGNTIKSGLDKVLPSGLDKLVQVQHVEQLVGAFASGLLQRFVFGPKGLFGDDTGSGRRVVREETIDIDGDNIWDGYDTDGDGELNICHHGLKNENLPESNANCYGSTEVKTSPYFVPMCQALENAGSDLHEYLQFLQRQTFNPLYSNTWMDRTVRANGSVESLNSIILQLQIMEYDPVVFTLGQYMKLLNSRITKLVREKPVLGLGYCATGLSGSQSVRDECARQSLIKNTTNVLVYLAEFKSKVIAGRCDNPNTGQIGTIVPPIIEIDDENPGQETSTSTPTSAGTLTPLTE